MNEFLIFLPLIILAICFILRIPLGFGMVGTGIVYLLLTGQDVSLVSSTIMGKIFSSGTIIAIPLFIFTANIMNSGKVTEYMFTFVKSLVGKKRGALGYINIIISLIFSGMSGAALADVAGIGTIEIEEMKKDGYDMPFSCALTVTSSVVGPIFPPSIPMVSYALITGASVGQLFMGGMTPAILISLILAVYVWYISKKRNYPTGKRFTFKEFIRYTWKALPALFTPVILLGGIYSGIVTPTEAGALAAFYTIIIAILAYKVLSFKHFKKAIRDTVVQTGVIFGIIIGAFTMQYIVTSSGMGETISNFFLGISDNKYVFLIIVNIAFLILGMFFDLGVMMWVFMPLFLPAVLAYGINLVHFGVIMVVNMMLGSSTPPYGSLCFVVGGMTDTPVQKIFKETLPMVGFMIIVLLLITYIPELVLWIPNLLMQ